MAESDKVFAGLRKLSIDGTSDKIVAAMQKAAAREQVARNTTLENLTLATSSSAMYRSNSRQAGVDAIFESAQAPAKLNGISDAFKKLSISGNDAHSAVRGLASGFNLLWLTWGNTIPLLMGTAVSMSVSKAVKMGAEFEQSLFVISELAGTSSEAMVQVKEGLLNIGEATKYGPVEAAKALENLTLAGLTATQALGALVPTLNFSSAGGVDPAAGAETLVAVATAYGVLATSTGTASDASMRFNYVADIVAKTAADTMASVSSMSESFKVSSVVAEQFGLTLNDTAEGLGILAQIGIKGSAAGTSFRNLIVGLNKEGGQVGTTMKMLGVSIQDNVTKNMRPLNDVMGEVTLSLMKYNEAAQRNILENITTERGAKSFAAYQATLMAAVLKTNPEIYEQIKLAEDAGNTYKATALKTDALKDAIAKLGEKARKASEDAAGFTFFASIADQITPIGQFKGLVSDLSTALVKSFEDSSSAVYLFGRRLSEAVNSQDFKTGVSSILEGFLSVLSAAADLTRFLYEHKTAVLSIGAAYLIAFSGPVSAIAKVVAASGWLATAVSWAGGIVTTFGVSLGLIGPAAIAAGTQVATGVALATGGISLLITLGIALATLATTWFFLGETAEESARKQIKAQRDAAREGASAAADQGKTLKELRDQRIADNEKLIASLGSGQTLSALKEELVNNKAGQAELEKAATEHADRMEAIYADRNLAVGKIQRKTGLEIALEAASGLTSSLDADAKSVLHLDSVAAKAGAAETARHEKAVAEIKEKNKYLVEQEQAISRVTANESVKKNVLFSGLQDFNLPKAPPFGGKGRPQQTPFEVDTKELETIKKQMDSRLAVQKSGFDLAKALQDSQHKNLIISDAQYFVASLAATAKFESESLAILQNSTEEYIQEYQKKYAAIAAARDKPGISKDEYKIQSDKGEKVINDMVVFIGSTTAKIEKIQDDAALRVLQTANDAAGRVNKLVKAEKDYWDKTDMDKSKAAALKEIDKQYQYMNTSMFSMAEGEKASAIAILESNAASEERNKTLQDELKLQKEIVTELEKMVIDPAMDSARVSAAVKELAVARASVSQLRELAKDSIDRGANEGAVAGTEALNKVFQAKKEKFVTSIGDAITTGIFDGAEAGQKKLRDMLVAALREPINTYVNVVVNSLTGAALEAIGISSKSSGGSGSTGFSPLSPTSFGDAFGAFSTSSFGQSLGLSKSVEAMGPAVEAMGPILEGSLDAALSSGIAPTMNAMTDTAASLAKGADMLGAVMSYASAFDSASQGKWGQAIGQGLGQYIGGPIGSLIGGEIGKAVDEAFGGEKRSGGTYGLGEAYDLRTNTYNTLGKTATFMEGPSGGKLSETENLINTTALSVGKLLELVGSSSKLIGFQAGSETSDSGRGGVYSGGTLTGGVRFGETGAGSNYDGGKYEDTSSKNGSATEIAKNFGDDMLQVTIQALQAASDVPKTISDMLNGIDAESLGTVEATALLDSISKLATDARTLMEATGASVFDNLKGMSFDLAATLIAASGDVSGLVANLNTYYDKFYTGPEKTANATANLNKAFAAMNIVMPEIDENTRAWYRSEVERLGAMDLNIEANAKAYTSVLSLSGAVDALAPALAGAAAAVSKTLSSLSDARFGLENNLLKLQGKSDEADARIRQADFDKLTEGITDAASLTKIAASYAQNMGLEKLIKNLEEQKGLQEQLNAITDTAAQALTRQRNALDETNRGLFDQVQAATKAKEATQRLSESWAELAAMIPNTLAKYRTPEQNRDAQYASIGKGLQDYGFVSADVGIDSIIAQLKAANKDTILAISTLMFDGLAETSVDAAKALLGFVDTLADIKDNEASTALTALNKTLDDAKTAAMEAEKAISDQRKTLVEQLFQLTATEAEKSAAAAAKARAEVDPSNYDVYDQIVEKTAELKTAAELAGLNTQLLTAQGDTIALRNEERAKLDASNRALYDRINYLNDEKAVTAALQTVAQQYKSFVDSVTSTKSAVDSASEGITSGYLSAVDAVAAAQEQVNSVTQQAGEAMLGFAKSIREFVAGLDQAEAGGLNKRGQYAAATSDYTIALAQARAGDKDAMSKVAGLAGSMLGLGKETGTNAEDYRMLVAQTKGALSELATGAETANSFAAAVDPMLAAQENLAKAQAELVLWNKAISESGASTSKSVADYAADWRVANTSYQTALKDMLTADKLVAGLDMTLSNPIKDLAAAVAALAAATGLRDSTGLGVGGIAGGAAGGSVPGGPMTATQIDSYNSTLYAGINQSNIAADRAKGEKFSSDISAIDSAGGAAYRAVIAAGGLRSDALAAREAAVSQAAVASGYGADLFQKRHVALFEDKSAGAYAKFVSEALGYSSDTYDLNKRLGIPGFANGGYHSGGIRLVGENGPEIEVTGASRIYNAADTANMLRGGGANNAEVVAELRALAARLEAIERNTSATAGHTAKSARQSERVMPGGDAITVRVIT